jgi:hypothetical protein
VFFLRPGKPAIGDDNRTGTDIQHLAILVCGNARDPAALQAQRCCSSAKQKPTLPILPGHLPARRRQREAMPADRATLSERSTLACQPVDCAACIGGIAVANS